MSLDRDFESHNFESLFLTEISSSFTCGRAAVESLPGLVLAASRCVFSYVAGLLLIGVLRSQAHSCFTDRERILASLVIFTSRLSRCPFSLQMLSDLFFGEACCFSWERRVLEATGHECSRA